MPLAVKQSALKRNIKDVPFGINHLLSILSYLRIVNYNHFLIISGLLHKYRALENFCVSETDLVRRILYGRHPTMNDVDYKKLTPLRHHCRTIIWHMLDTMKHDSVTVSDLLVFRPSVSECLSSQSKMRVGQSTCLVEQSPNKDSQALVHSAPDHEVSKEKSSPVSVPLSGESIGITQSKSKRKRTKKSKIKINLEKLKKKKNMKEFVIENSVNSKTPSAAQGRNPGKNDGLYEDSRSSNLSNIGCSEVTGNDSTTSQQQVNQLQSPILEKLSVQIESVVKRIEFLERSNTESSLLKESTSNKTKQDSEIDFSFLPSGWKRYAGSCMSDMDRSRLAFHEMDGDRSRSDHKRKQKVKDKK